jgi:predicted amidohydrolase YtcJ
MSHQTLVDELGADLVLLNGKIVTVDPSETIAEAVAVKDGRFLKVGSSDEIKRLAGSRTKIIDLKGKTVLPGFIDSHEHCIRRGLRGDTVDCTATRWTAPRPR